MPHTVTRNGGCLDLCFHGHVDLEDAATAVRVCATLDADHATEAMCCDMTAVESMSFDVEELHRLATEIRLHYERGPDYRIAYVSASAAVAPMIRAFEDVRNLLTARQPESLPRMRLFTTVADARAWLDGGLDPET